MTEKTKKENFAIYSKSVNSILHERHLVEIIDYNLPNFTIEIQDSRKLLENIKINELKEIWTNDKQLKQIGFVNFGDYYQLKDIVIFRPKYDLEISDENDNNLFIEKKSILFGNQIFVANHAINENYYTNYKKNNFLNLEKFYKKHVEVTLLLNLFEYLDLKKIKYNRKEISMLTNFLN